MKNFILISICFLILSCGKESKIQKESYDIGEFSFSSKNIYENKPFTITYNGDGELETGFYHMLDEAKVYAKDLYFTDHKATLSIPDSIAFVSFFFRVDNEQDNNDNKGYLFYVSGENDSLKPHTEASKQIYLTRTGNFYELEGGDEKRTFYEVSNLIKKYPNDKEKWFETHLQVASSSGKDNINELKEFYISEINSKKMLELEDYMKMLKIYDYSRDIKSKDSINATIKEKYPDSDFAQDAIINEFYEKKSSEERIEFYNSKLKGFNRPDMNFVHTQLAMDYYKQGDIDNFHQYIDKVERVQNKTSALNNLAWNNAENDKDLDFSKDISKLSVDLIKSEIDAQNDKPDYLSPNQYKDRLEYSYHMNLDTYAYILFKTGSLKEAIKIQEDIVGEGLNVEYNERYIEYLIKDEQFETVYLKSKDFISSGNSTGKIKSYFKTAHKTLDKKEDYETVLGKLEAQALAKFKEDLTKEILNVDAPEFSAVNLDGKTYTLESLKGKTVVLDFWATWCGPCKASFPGMQKVVDKYKDNDDIVFLFVDTFERGEDRLEKVSSFIDKEGYTFEVLIDPLDEDNNKHKIADAFGVEGIPTKFIIDKNGKIKFEDVGYSGSEEKLIQKIDVMIDLLQ